MRNIRLSILKHRKNIDILFVSKNLNTQFPENNECSFN